MVTPTQRLKDTLGFLSGQLNWGWSFLSLAKALRNADWLTSARWFRVASYNACLNEAVLILAKLAIENQQSITFFDLLNQAEDNPNLFQFADLGDIQTTVAQHRQAIQQHPVFPNVRTQRNKVIAHFDKQHISDPPAITSAPVDMTEVEDCYRQLLGILNAYKGYYDNSELHLELTTQMIQDDVDYLTRLIQEDNE
jgi:hypothetical protein